MINYLKNIFSLHRYLKRIIAIMLDIILCVLSTWLAYIIRLEELILLRDFNLYPALIAVIVSLPIYWSFGLYRTIFRYSGLSIIFTILKPTFVYGLIYFLIIGVYTFKGIPRSIGVFQPMILFFSIIASRLLIKSILTNRYNFKTKKNKKNILIYGAGDAGRQLAVALENSPEFKVCGFIDDNKQLHKQDLLGITVFSPQKLKKLILNKKISLALLALPTINRKKRNLIIERLSSYNLSVNTLPSISEIVSGRITISDIKDFNIEDLLNRDEINPDFNLLTKNIKSKTVLVTGAGGSIGSEICRQIVKLKPNKLILLELNEFALYKIYEELLSLSKNLKIFPILLNAQDQLKLEIIFENFKVDTVYHAAAYKHVSLVEENICEGVKNNVFSTLAVAKASIVKKVSNLVLISSDKAVRPTNIMGATKRLSELCMQGIYNYNKGINTNFSIVRFGNVLESSGSVIPKFKKQIKEGGPITLTHREVTRYFMTVREAAQLVIQAGAMGKNADVFVLDMGKSVKIRDLIYKLIRLSGFSIKDDENPSGEIEIKEIGLRPGEKLHEELLIGDNPKKTEHLKIMKTIDPFLPFEKLEPHLNKLKNFIVNNDVPGIKNVLSQDLKIYINNIELVDHIYLSQKNSDNQ